MQRLKILLLKTISCNKHLGNNRQKQVNNMTHTSIDIFIRWYISTVPEGSGSFGHCDPNKTY